MRQVMWVVLFWVVGVWGKDPEVLYLTWRDDPTTTMTVQWHTLEKEPLSEVMYREVGEEKWHLGVGSYLKLSKSRVLVHTVDLGGLKPGGSYEFFLGGHRGEMHKFRTLPSQLDGEIKFVVGGDAYRQVAKFRRMCEQIVKLDPAFVVVGGDIAYTVNTRALFKGKGWELERWQAFFKEWKEQMVTSDGRMIPMLVTLGNHDVKHTGLDGNEGHYLFYQLFALPGAGVPYQAFDVGDYLSLFLLDSGHSYHIEGAQAKWLGEALKERQGRPHKMAMYHISAYPAVYPYEGGISRRIRYYWSPLFEEYGVQAVFEHHNHTYKRTFPLKRGEINPEGVVYVGDGSWGVHTRAPKDLWYLEAKAKVNAVCVTTVRSNEVVIEAMDEKGQMIDQVILPAKAQLRAEAAGP